MPSTDPLYLYDESKVKALLRFFLNNIRSEFDVLWIVQYCFELFIILKCKSLGMFSIDNAKLYSNDPRWRMFAEVRNRLSHGLALTTKTKSEVSRLLKSNILEDCAAQFLGNRDAVKLLLFTLKNFDFDSFENEYVTAFSDTINYKGVVYSVEEICSVVPESEKVGKSKLSVARSYVKTYAELFGGSR